jgi:hypothetical protein
VRADDRLVDAAGARLPHPSEAVDDEVVADVIPAVRVAVEATDREECGGDMRA